MNLKKIIEVYKRDKFNPQKTYNIKFVKEYDISSINISEIKTIIQSKKDDENLYLCYTLSSSQLKKIEELSELILDLDNEKFIYIFCQCDVK